MQEREIQQQTFKDTLIDAQTGQPLHVPGAWLRVRLDSPPLRGYCCKGRSAALDFPAGPWGKTQDRAQPTLPVP